MASSYEMRCGRCGFYNDTKLRGLSFLLAGFFILDRLLVFSYIEKLVLVRLKEYYKLYIKAMQCSIENPFINKIPAFCF